METVARGYICGKHFIYSTHPLKPPEGWTSEMVRVEYDRRRTIRMDRLHSKPSAFDQGLVPYGETR